MAHILKIESNILVKALNLKQTQMIYCAEIWGDLFLFQMKLLLIFVNINKQQGCP